MRFTYRQPTEIRFGPGRLAELGEVTAPLGKRALLVSGKPTGPRVAVIERARSLLEESGLAVAHFAGVVPNPTTECVDAGAKMARDFGADVVVGLGGGSSMDTAKAIAVGATHPGTAWDYLFFKAPPTAATLPIVAVSTTSGTGSHVTQVAVLTETRTHTKSAIYHPLVFPRVAIVDPELAESVPAHVTASTGFDVMAHAFESFIHVGGNPYSDLMALEALRLVRLHLPAAVRNGSDVEARRGMAWADTLAGQCIATAGVTLPHGIGMTIGGFAPHVMHGESLAVIYPEFIRFTWGSAVPKFAALGRTLDPALQAVPERAAAEGACPAMDAFLREIGMWLSFEDLGVGRELLGPIADHSRVLPDYGNNPRIAERDEIFAMLQSSYRR